MKHTASIPNKIFQLEDLQRQVAAWRTTGASIAFTNGVFDLLHEGHLYSLSEAAATADKLIVALNSDASVQRLKGPTRPLHGEQTRALVLASLLMVDAVIIFDTDTPQPLIAALLPDVLVKGGDYTVEQIAGSAEVLAAGGRVVINPLIPGISTTALVQKMKGNS